MRHISNDERMRAWVVDYSAARARAIAWLGDRYLLARPVKRLDTLAMPSQLVLSAGARVDDRIDEPQVPQVA